MEINKTLRNLAIIILILLHLCLLGQQPFDGIYKDKENNVVCIKGDSIVFCLQDYSKSVYYGKYTVKDKEIRLLENQASFMVASVEKTKCDEDFIEIELIEWHQHVLTREKSEAFTVFYGGHSKSTTDSILRLSKSDLYSCILDENLELSFVSNSMSGFWGEVVLPMAFGNKYTIVQKYDSCVPFVSDEYSPSVIITLSRKKAGNKPILKWQRHRSTYHGEETRKLKRVGDCDSCLEGLRMYYPMF